MESFRAKLKSMVDPQRSAIMRAVKSENTSPEMSIRKFVHGRGFRYCLHRKDLPGTPDLVFPCLKRIIFVHGCFWHGHSCARGSRKPKTNQAYWEQKIARNAERDKQQLRTLRRFGWSVLVIWECHLRSKPAATNAAILKFLNAPKEMSPT